MSFWIITRHDTPFGDTRHSARDLVAMMRFQMDTLAESQKG